MHFMCGIGKTGQQLFPQQPAFYKARWLLRYACDVWYNVRMGLVKTRRLAAMQKQQRAKAAMKPPMKVDPRNLRSGRKVSDERYK